MWVKFLSRNSEVFKIYTNYLSCLVYNQVYNLFVCTLCPCLTSFSQWNYNEIPAFFCHMSRGRAVLDLIASRKHDTAIISELWKKSISNLHVAGMPDNLTFFLTMQFYRSQACDPRAFLSAKCTLRVLSCCLFVCLFCCLLFVLVQHISPVLI